MLFLTPSARVRTDADSSDCSVAEPCEKTYCAYGADCIQTPDGHAECLCPTECPSMFTPVCGTDGVTYTNHCMMRMKSCRQEKNTRVKHSGECGEYLNFSVDVACSVSGIVQECQQKSTGLKFLKSQTGSDVRYSFHHNSSRFTFPIFAPSCRFSVLHSLQSITPRIY